LIVSIEGLWLATTALVGFREAKESLSEAVSNPVQASRSAARSARPRRSDTQPDARGSRFRQLQFSWPPFGRNCTTATVSQNRTTPHNRPAAPFRCVVYGSRYVVDRFLLLASGRELADAFDVPGAPCSKRVERYNIAPGQTVPGSSSSVDGWSGGLASDADGGLVPSWAKDAAGSDYKVDQRQGLKRSLGTSRRPRQRGVSSAVTALFRASGFYEWRTEGQEEGCRRCFRPSFGAVSRSPGLWGRRGEGGRLTRSRTFGLADRLRRTRGSWRPDSRTGCRSSSAGMTFAAWCWRPFPLGEKGERGHARCFVRIPPGLMTATRARTPFRE